MTHNPDSNITMAGSSFSYMWGVDPEEKPSDIVTCPECGGDGKETCHNPDHGFISMLGFHDVGRLGCPVCGHHPEHKVRSGGDCETCAGTGYTATEKARLFCVACDYDYEDVMSHLPVHPGLVEVGEGA